MKRMTRTIWILLLALSGLIVACKHENSVLPPGGGSSGNTDTASGKHSLFDSAKVIVWIEAAANFSRLGTAANMSTVFQKLADMGAKGVVIDVKGITGLVNFNSSIAGQLVTWNGYTREDGFDYLQNAITEARKKGLKVFASMSVFAEGMNYYGVRYGKVFTDPAFADMQSQVVTAAGVVKKITDVYSY